MSKSIHSLARLFLNRDSLEECSLQDIRELATQYPYASAIQFLLLEKLRGEDQIAYEAQLKKSVLYYHDPLSFQYFLHPERFQTHIPDEQLPARDEVLKNGDEEQPDDKLPSETTPQSEPADKAVTAGDAPEPPEPKVFIDHTIEETAEQKSGGEEEIRIKPLVMPEPSKNDLVFDPYHTVDYFASQGIKLSQEDFSKDKFGKQLKSFTEWLKSMKKLPSNQVAPPVDSRTEDKVQHLAQDSIHESEVYTEAMADVWIKQGNKAKAIEVYNKLSLINPSKKAYFATQIQNLKQS